MTEGREQRLRLHRRIYPARAVKETITAFAGVASAQLHREGDYHVLILSPATRDLSIERLVLEFANYALSRAARSR